MSARTYVLILFFWAVLTIVTPILVRLSANAKQKLYCECETREELKVNGAMGLLHRRALISMARTRAAASAPGPAGKVAYGMKRLLPVLEGETAFRMKRLLKEKR